MKGRVVKFTFPRTGRMHGVTIGGAMGLSTWAAFSGGAMQVVVDGDFIMEAAEVQTVMHALREADIHVVALHNHMIGGEPHYYFLHYWGQGVAVKLARGLRSAMAVQEKVQVSGGQQQQLARGEPAAPYHAAVQE